MLSCIGQIKLMRQLTRVQQDGRVEFDFEENTELAENVFGPETSGPPGDEYTESEEDETWQPIPPLKIVMLIVGTRGDVQPFLAIGKRLQVLSRLTHHHLVDLTKSFLLHTLELLVCHKFATKRVFIFFDALSTTIVVGTKKFLNNCVCMCAICMNFYFI
jgi:hypothetical protein